jgi:hypothetical protein
MAAQLSSSIPVGFVKSKSVNYSHLCVVRDRALMAGETI